jgi:hypothetical protein
VSYCKCIKIKYDLLMRASSWRTSLCPSSPYPSLDIVSGPYDEQIQLDLCRTYPEVKWFDPHRSTLCGILNTFSVVNEGFGYPQGLNYLAFPLYYVYYRDHPKTAVEDTFYSLQSLVRVVLPLYPLDAKDASAFETICSVANMVTLQCYEADPKLSILFSETHMPFVTSLVSSIMPTLYANVFTLQDTLLLWDEIISHSCKAMFKSVVQIMVHAILFHKNMFIHMPVDKSMMLFQRTLRASVSVCL